MGMLGFGDTTPGRDKTPYIEDVVDVFPWPIGDYEAVRLIGPVFSYAYIWFETPGKNGGKNARFSKICLDHDGRTDKMVTDVCPYRKLVAQGKGNLSKVYLVNGIIRSLQEGKRFPSPNQYPGKRGQIVNHLGYKCYLAQKGDTRLTPVRPIIFTGSTAETLQKMKKLNRVDLDGRRVDCEVSDEKYGIDINIMKDESKEGARRYDIQRADRTRISPEERRYLIYPLNLLKAQSLDEARAEAADIGSRALSKNDHSDQLGATSREDERGGGRDRYGNREDRGRGNRRSAVADDDVASIGDVGDLEAELGGLDDSPRARPRRGGGDEFDRAISGRENRRPASRDERRPAPRDRDERRPPRDRDERRPAPRPVRRDMDERSARGDGRTYRDERRPAPRDERRGSSRPAQRRPLRDEDVPY